MASIPFFCGISWLLSETLIRKLANVLGPVSIESKPLWNVVVAVQ
jgi:hypothetical protein